MEPPEYGLVLLHGFMGSSFDWPDLDTSNPGPTVYAPDLPGHGTTPIPTAGLSMDYMVDWLDAQLTARGFGRIELVGYSMGGRIAMHYALAHPERCSRLVCVSASPGIRDAEAREARLKLDEQWAERLESTPIDEFLRSWYQQPVFASLRNRPDLLEVVVSSRRYLDAKQAAAVLRALSVGRTPPLWDRLEELPMPTLAIAGALDGKYVDIARAMAVAAENVSTSIVPGAGHVVHLEQETAFLQVLGGFLEYLPPARINPQSKPNAPCP